jgi:hypothetical protein
MIRRHAVKSRRQPQRHNLHRQARQNMDKGAALTYCSSRLPMQGVRPPATSRYPPRRFGSTRCRSPLQTIALC